MVELSSKLNTLILIAYLWPAAPAVHGADRRDEENNS
jgi:hypothetical protein